MLWLGTLVEAHILIAIVGSAFAAHALVGILALILGAP